MKVSWSPLYNVEIPGGKGHSRMMRNEFEAALLVMDLIKAGVSRNHIIVDARYLNDMGMEWVFTALEAKNH